MYPHIIKSLGVFRKFVFHFNRNEKLVPNPAELRLPAKCPVTGLEVRNHGFG